MSNDHIINYVLHLQVLLMSKQIGPGELDFLPSHPTLSAQWTSSATNAGAVSSNVVLVN